MKIQTEQKRKETKTMISLVKKISDEIKGLDKTNSNYQTKYQTLFAVREDIIHSMLK